MGWVWLGLIKWALVLLDAVGVAVVFLVIFAPLQNLLKWRRVRWIVVAVCWIFGAPIGSNLLKYRNDLWNRYISSVSDIQNQDRALAYIERVVDRQISKARGILPFNLILLVINGLELNALHSAPIANLPVTIEYLVLVALGLSSIILLELFWVRWSTTDIYSDFFLEFTSSVLVTRKRTILLALTITFSVMSVIGMATVAYMVPRKFGSPETSRPPVPPPEAAPQNTGQGLPRG
jgi:hypothetical protein